METLLPDNLYIVKVTNVEDKVSEATQRPYKLLQLRVILDGHRTSLYLYKPVSPARAAEWVWRQFVEHYDDLPTLIGKRLVVKVRTTRFQSEDRNEVQLLGTAHRDHRCNYVESGAI